ncbi:hypothetical protein SGFS_100210 [Streptomyces graminofaciens]|uniref:Secreted protein n=1 Tax=Streptomyces graminofaciens TaxID=68212 RepID=A0ABM7FLF0_9ACTN|nr:hypothetical protein SGFS_100210 [Streptomyces graminofaciens]
MVATLFAVATRGPVPHAAVGQADDGVSVSDGCVSDVSNRRVPPPGGVREQEVAPARGVPSGARSGSRGVETDPHSAGEGEVILSTPTDCACARGRPLVTSVNSPQRRRPCR